MASAVPLHSAVTDVAAAYGLVVALLALWVAIMARHVARLRRERADIEGR
jgi:hypothetical protein